MAADTIVFGLFTSNFGISRLLGIKVLGLIRCLSKSNLGIKSVAMKVEGSLYGFHAARKDNTWPKKELSTK